MPPKKEKKKLSAKASSSGSAEGPLVQLRPSQILYTYSKVLPYFSGCGRTLQSTLDQIASGELKASDLPAISVIGAEVPVGVGIGTDGGKDGSNKKKSQQNQDDDGWSSSDDDDGGRGRRNTNKRGGKNKRSGGGGGGGGGGGKKGAEKETKFFSTNNRRLWVLKQCEERGLLGSEGTVGVRLQRPDVSRRMVEKGTRSFRIERATDKVTLIKVDRLPTAAEAREAAEREAGELARQAAEEAGPEGEPREGGSEGGGGGEGDGDGEGAGDDDEQEEEEEESEEEKRRKKMEEEERKKMEAELREIEESLGDAFV